MNVLDRIKPIHALLAQTGTDSHGTTLKKTLGVWGLTALGIGAIIGTGIFVLTGSAAATKAGPAIVFSFVIAGLVSTFAALCYAELASTIPVAGSAYTYVYATLGEFLAWIVGWGLILEYALGAATVAIGWSAYFCDFFRATWHVAVPQMWTQPPPVGILNIPALLIIVIMSLLLIRGTGESATVNKIIVGVKLAIVVLFIVVGVRHVDAVNWTPFLPFGVFGVIAGAARVFFAYIGFDAVSTSAEEVANPGRDLPRGIIASLAICTVLYIIVSAILTGMVSYKKLDVASPVSFAMLQVGLDWAASIISVGAIAGLTTVLLVLLFGQSRIFFAMARDGLLPPFFSRLHPQWRTPWISSATIGVVVALAAGLSTLDFTADLVNMGTLVAFVFVAIGVIALRRREPNLKRGFRVPWSPVVPIIAAASALGLIAFLSFETKRAYVIWLVIGLCVYFFYSRRHSVVGNDATPKPG